MWLTLLVHRVIRRPVCLTHIALLRVVNKFRSDILSPVSIRDVYCIIQSDKYEQGVPTICPYKGLSVVKYHAYAFAYMQLLFRIDTTF